MVVDVDTGDTFERGTPRQLFPDRYFLSATKNWDVTPDGRFLMIAQSDVASEPQQLNVVLNWFEELTRLAPVP